MTITTKYSLASQVWVMHENKPRKYNIFSIEPVVRVVFEAQKTSETIIKYRLEDHGKLYLECELFESKESLLQSL